MLRIEAGKWAFHFPKYEAKKLNFLKYKKKRNSEWVFLLFELGKFPPKI